jgi:putative SbcD/Mre11-related phosphoesterase
MKTSIMTRRKRLICANERHVEIRPEIWLHRERALYLERERTLVIADIHWGYAHSHRHHGNLLPLWGNERIGQRLHALLTDYTPGRMVWLGDSLHTPESAIFAEKFLEEVDDSVEVVIIAGNHDRKWNRAKISDFRLDNYFLHHGDRLQSLDEGITEIIGHIHPAFSWSDGAGTSLKIPVLVEEKNRLILPAFSDWSSGATWNDKIKPGENLWLISSQRIFSYPPKIQD